MPASLRQWWFLGSALALASLLLPAIVPGQGLRSAGAAVTLVVIKQAPPVSESAIRDIELPVTWSGTPTRVTVRIAEEGTGGAALFVRHVSGRLERARGNVIEVPLASLRFRVVHRAGGPIPAGRWRVEVRAEGSASGIVEVASHTVEVR